MRKRRCEHETDVKANEAQIIYRRSKLFKQVKSQWSKFEPAFSKYRPILDFVVHSKLEPIRKAKEQASAIDFRSNMAAQTPQYSQINQFSPINAGARSSNAISARQLDI